MQANIEAGGQTLLGTQANLKKAVKGKSTESKEERLAEFIDETNIDDIAYILSNGSKEEVVVIFNSLPEIISAKIFSKLPISKQRELINELKEIKFKKPYKEVEDFINSQGIDHNTLFRIGDIDEKELSKSFSKEFLEELARFLGYKFDDLFIDANI